MFYTEHGCLYEDRHGKDDEESSAHCKMKSYDYIGYFILHNYAGLFLSRMRSMIIELGM